MTDLHLYEFEGLFEEDRAIVLASNQSTAEELLRANGFTSWRKVWCVGMIPQSRATQRVLLAVQASNLNDGELDIRSDQGKVELSDSDWIETLTKSWRSA